MNVQRVKNHATNWSFERREINARCGLCYSDITGSREYEVFDDKGNSKGLHHLICAEKRVRRGC